MAFMSMFMDKFCFHWFRMVISFQYSAHESEHENFYLYVYIRIYALKTAV